MPSPLYIFDMDDTLIDGDCSMLWNQFLVDKGLVSDPNFLTTDRQLMALYGIGKLDMQAYLAFTMQPLATIPSTKVDELVTQFVKEYVEPRVFKEAQTLLADLQQKQIPIVIISATVSFIVTQVAQALGIEQALGIDMAIINNRYSADIVGIPSYREGKIARLEDWMNHQDTEFSPLHFYTDSINDLPLCKYADHAYLINPCPQLEHAAQEQDWPIYHWCHHK